MPWLDDADQGIWMCPELHLVTYLFIWAFCLNRALLLQIGFDECCARNATSPWTPTSNLAKAASVVPMETPSYEPFSLFSSLHSIPPASARVSTWVGGTGSRYSMEHTDVGGYGFILTCTRKTERDTSDWFYESRCLAKCERKWVNLKKILCQYESMGTNENGGPGVHGARPPLHPHPGTSLCSQTYLCSHLCTHTPFLLAHQER